MRNGQRQAALPDSGGTPDTDAVHIPGVYRLRARCALWDNLRSCERSFVLIQLSLV